MIIKHDKRLVNEKLINKGYAELTVHSLHFDRYFTDDEKENNLRLSHTMNRDEWSIHCDEKSKDIYKQLLLVINAIKDKYNIHQLTEETSTMQHFRESWDLFFYSNKGWNQKDYFDYFSLGFNEKRSIEDNNRLLNELLTIIEPFIAKNIYCRVQYTHRHNKEKIEQDGTAICKKLTDKMIAYYDKEGKIKVVGQDKEGNNLYGFFKKGARKYYSDVSFEYLVLNMQ